MSGNAAASGSQGGGYRQRHLLGTEGLTAAELTTVLDLADQLTQISEQPIKRVPTLRGKTVINYFAEASTRTRTSFELAGKRLSADVINMSDSGSSVTKGETLLDTAKNLDAMHPDVVVLRHPSAGAPHFIAKHIRAAVINAGDGMHEHPTQALIDCGTIRKHKGKIAGLTVTIVGDIAHSRVARSNVHALKALGAEVRVAGPFTLLPLGFDRLGARVFERVEPALEGTDVVMVLRLQKERMNAGLIPNTREFSRYFGINRRRLALAKPDAIVMHPGPINRGVELEPDVADGARSVILDQVSYGVAVRMAALYLLIRPQGEVLGSGAQAS